jgi:hypothetical protein
MPCLLTANGPFFLETYRFLPQNPRRARSLVHAADEIQTPRAQRDVVVNVIYQFFSSHQLICKK